MVGPSLTRVLNATSKFVLITACIKCGLALTKGLTRPSGIDPWEILIDGDRWDGKIRLVGFVDAFYLICYAGESRFEHGIVVYSGSSLSSRRPGRAG